MSHGSIRVRAYPSAQRSLNTVPFAQHHPKATAPVPGSTMKLLYTAADMTYYLHMPAHRSGWKHLRHCGGRGDDDGEVVLPGAQRQRPFRTAALRGDRAAGAGTDQPPQPPPPPGGSLPAAIILIGMEADSRKHGITKSSRLGTHAMSMRRHCTELMKAASTQAQMRRKRTTSNGQLGAGHSVPHRMLGTNLRGRLAVQQAPLPPAPRAAWGRCGAAAGLG